MSERFRCSDCGHTERDAIHLSITVIAGAPPPGQPSTNKPDVTFPPMCEFRRQAALVMSLEGSV